MTSEIVDTLKTTSTIVTDASRVIGCGVVKNRSGSWHAVVANSGNIIRSGAFDASITIARVEGAPARD